MQKPMLNNKLQMLTFKGASNKSAQPKNKKLSASARIKMQMDWLENLSVRATLLLAFASLLVGSLAIGTFSLTQMRRINASTQTLYNKEFISTRAAEEARGFLLNATRAQNRLMTATTTTERNDLGVEIEKALANINKEVQAIQKLTTDQEGIALAKKFADSIAKWSGHLRDFIGLVKDQPLDLTAMSFQVSADDVDLSIETGKLEKLVNELVTKRGDSAKATIDQAATIYNTSFVMVAVMTLVLIIFAGIISSWVIRRLSRQLGGEPVYAKSIAGRIANGDLTTSIKTLPNDTISILYELKQMQVRLAQTVGEIAASSEAIASASGEISMGNTDLSERTEQQAISLEKTAASMDQLTSTVKQNADNARQASELALKASKIATKGGDVVSRVVTTMSDINGSAKSIADIIGVIEAIAFQTNILALNAAVEAARAGEQGRGFSVVAAEVRNLAQRSAVAAKEIKELIGTSVQRVQNGSVLVEEAGRTMNEIVTAVKHVTDIMTEISAASENQSVDIQEVNKAVLDMDSTTQQNAALVEQAAAAAQSVDDQARVLKGLVANFKLV